MTTQAAPIRAQRFHRLGEIIEYDRTLLVDRWMERVIAEDPGADSARRGVMRDELPEYLRLLGRQLARSGTDDAHQESQRTAEDHGKQRWHVGWSLDEVVRDYQVMRLVIIQHLDEVLDASLTIDEIMAVNLTLDRAISGSVLGFVEESESRYQKLNESLEDKVAERTRQLRELARALVEAEQRERRRLARLLHEHFQQLLFAIRLRLQKLWSVVAPVEESLIQEMDGLISEAIKDARTLTTSLSPPVLHDGGLVPALEILGDVMAERHELEVSFDVGAGIEPESMEIREFLYQAVRELLLNVVKHSGERRADVSLRRAGPSRMQLTVEDQGRGIPARGGESSEIGPEGFGLADIRQRVEVLGGQMGIAERQPNGTLITIEVPVSLLEGIADVPPAQVPIDGAAPSATRQPGSRITDHRSRIT